MTTITPWSDTPPSEEKQRYWVRRRESETEEPGWLENDQWLFSWPFERWFPEDFPEEFQFGPRVLSAEETVALTAEVERLRAELATVRGAMAAQDERERIAGGRCGVPYEQHGCDWPEWVADEVLKLRAENAELREKLTDDAPFPTTPFEVVDRFPVEFVGVQDMEYLPIEDEKHGG